ncbi:MAG: Cytochrome b6-f complex iron-sulfur subunit [Phycisphaerae bacterium]|nr:Cytochrome b6-f complex iron-sulfur subunit [Phycisphaerae bacterium]
MPGADFQVVKVWIEPGCIVCDACETACPDVFDVQQETCVVKPGAQYAGISAQILEATTGCPVDVIRFETADGKVATSDGLPGMEEAAPAAVEAGAPAADRPAVPKPRKDVAPDEGVQRMLDSANVTPGRSTRAGEAAGGKPAVARQLTDVRIRDDWPADLKFAVLLARPRQTLVKPEPVPRAIGEQSGMSRRQFNVALATAWGAFAASAAIGLGAIGRFMHKWYVPKKPPRFRAGRMENYPDVNVYEEYKKSEQVWIVHLPDNTLVALSTICTHLGCTPNWLPNDNKFKCPCHGSGYRMTGINFEGPAPRPLPRYKIENLNDVVWVDKSIEFRWEKGDWGKPGSFIQLV